MTAVRQQKKSPMLSTKKAQFGRTGPQEEAFGMAGKGSGGRVFYVPEQAPGGAEASS